MTSANVWSGYFPDSKYESAPNSLYSLPTVTIVSVFLLVAVFSTIANGYPGLTNVAFINDEPKSSPNTLPLTVLGQVNVLKSIIPII